MIGAVLAKNALAGAFDALNKHDLSRFMSKWREDGVFSYPGDIPQSGIFKGKGAVEGWFIKFFEQFPEIRFEIQDICVRNIFDLLGNNVAAVRWNIHLTNREGHRGENSGVTFIGINRGKVIWAKDFIFDLGSNFRLNWSAA